MNKITPVPVSSLTAIEYQGHRVVTFAMIDAVHGRVEGTARRNFAANRARLIEGEDYFLMNLCEFRTAYPDVAPTRGGGEIALIAESGYMMLVKSLNDDLAWGVQRQLVKQYFRQPRHEPAQLTRMQILAIAMEAEQENTILRPKANAHDAYAVGAGFYMISDVWRMAGIREDTLTEWITSKADLDWGFRFREGGAIRPVQAAKDAGLVDYKRFPTVGADGKVNKGSPVFCFTDRGLNIIMERVASDKLRQGSLTLIQSAA